MERQWKYQILWKSPSRCRIFVGYCFVPDGVLALLLLTRNLASYDQQWQRNEYCSWKLQAALTHSQPRPKIYHECSVGSSKSMDFLSAQRTLLRWRLGASSSVHQARNREGDERTSGQRPMRFLSHRSKKQQTFDLRIGQLAWWSPSHAIPLPCRPIVACMRKDIWREWALGYVPNRIEHRTWLKYRRNFKVCDMVMMMEPDKHGSFPRGRIFKVFASEDAYDDIINIHRPAMQALYERFFSSNN